MEAVEAMDGFVLNGGTGAGDIGSVSLGAVGLWLLCAAALGSQSPAEPSVCSSPSAVPVALLALVHELLQE